MITRWPSPTASRWICKRVLSVLEIVRDRRTLSRQFARLAHRHKSGAEVIRKRGREDKTTRFNANHRINLLTFKLRRQRIDRIAQTLGMFQQSGDVIKIDAGLGKVRHFTD